jgi:hypothetical protein
VYRYTSETDAWHLGYNSYMPRDTARRHNSLYSYREGCRCPPCTAAHSHYQGLFKSDLEPVVRKEQQTHYERELYDHWKVLMELVMDDPILNEIIQTIWGRLLRGVEVGPVADLVASAVLRRHPSGIIVSDAEREAQLRRILDQYGPPPE